MKKGIAGVMLCLALSTVYAQSVGIGISAPISLLHVSDGSPGIIPGPIAVATFESNGDMGINLLTPSANESGIFFGNPLHTAHGGIVYNSITPFGFDFRTNDNVTRMVLTDIGNVGIGVNNPSDKLHVNALTGDALRVQINSSTKLRVMSNGGTTIGASVTPPANGLRVSGPIEPVGGIVSSTEPIRIESTTDSIEIKAGMSRIIIHASGSIKILAVGGNDITIDAGTGDVILKGSGIDINATAQVDITGSSIDVISTGITDILGNIVRFNGGSTPIAKQGSTVTVTGPTGTITGNVSTTVLTQ